MSAKTILGSFFAMSQAKPGISALRHGVGGFTKKIVYSEITIESGKDFPGFLISHHHQQGNTAHERALEWRSTAESGVLL